MKKANNNEMDLLLRSFGRSGRDDFSPRIGSAAGDDNGEMREHLDADELNTFAEGLVPEPARARYTEHLADCASCRGIVVSLAQSSGMVSPEPMAASGTQSGVWQMLAALFSSPVLRYALPVVALTAVLGIVFMALRSERSREFVAGQYGTPPASVVEPGVKEQPIGTSGKDVSLVPRTQVEPKASPDSGREKSNLESKSGEIANSPAKTDLAAAASTSKDSADAAPPAAVSEGRGSQPVFAPEPKAVALASERPVISDVHKKAETPKEEQRAARVAQQRERDDYKVEASKENEDKGGATYSKAPSGPRRSEAPMTERRGYGLKNKKSSSDEDETRSISGRRFRREGSVWIDTGYEASRATINVLRNSEQFRALVADEPGIRAIANQLEGDVILVWKGKAYRLR